jgi:glycosyltransferase involved in cell wall biosynthesis
MKNIVTLFRRTKNIHLFKGVAQIPYCMFLKYGYNPVILTFDNKDELYYLNDLPNLKINFIPKKPTLSFFNLSILKYLFFNSKKIDVLNLYFSSFEIICYGILYKIFNPKGFLYLKLDAGKEEFEEQILFKYFHRNKIKNRILEYFKNLFFKKVDLISVETRYCLKLLKNQLKNYNVNNKIDYMPIGINDYFVEKNIPKILDFFEKENIILSVGRIGSPEKNNELLLKAALNLDLSDWKIIFAGPIVDQKFRKLYEKIISEKPALKNKIILFGNVKNKIELFELYNKSKIFCHTSNNESFGTVLAEAIYFGNYIVMTDVSSANDITDNNNLGKIIKVNNLTELVNALNYCIKTPEIMQMKYELIKKYSRENFVWSKIIDTLNSYINKKSYE